MTWAICHSAVARQPESVMELGFILYAGMFVVHAGCDTSLCALWITSRGHPNLKKPFLDLGNCSIIKMIESWAAQLNCLFRLCQKKIFYSIDISHVLLMYSTWRYIVKLLCIFKRCSQDIKMEFVVSDLEWSASPISVWLKWCSKECALFCQVQYNINIVFVLKAVPVLYAELFTLAVKHREATEKLVLRWTAHPDTELCKLKFVEWLRHIIIQMRWIWLFIILFSHKRFSFLTPQFGLWVSFLIVHRNSIQPGVLFSLQYYVPPIRPGSWELSTLQLEDQLSKLDREDPSFVRLDTLSSLPIETAGSYFERHPSKCSMILLKKMSISHSYMLVLFWDVLMFWNDTLLSASKFNLNMRQVLWFIKDIYNLQHLMGSACAYIVSWEHTRVDSTTVALQ